jgi:hypothetical protein
MAALVVHVPLLARGFGANGQLIGLLVGIYQRDLLLSGVVLARRASNGDGKRLIVCGSIAYVAAMQRVSKSFLRLKQRLGQAGCFRRRVADTRDGTRVDGLVQVPAQALVGDNSLLVIRAWLLIRRSSFELRT